MTTKKINLKNSAIFWVIVLVLVIWFFYSVSSILFPFVVGLFFSYLLNPIVNRFEKKGIKRSFSAICITFVLALIIMATMVLVIPSVFNQLISLLKEIPNYIEKFRSLVIPKLEGFIGQIKLFTATEETDGAKEKLSQLVNNYSGDLVYFMGNIINKIIFSGTSILNFLSLLFVTPIVTFYIIKDWPKFTKNVKNLIPKRHLNTFTSLSNEVSEILSGFLRGQTNICIILMFYYSIALVLNGVQYGLLIGLLTGLFSFIPYVGFSVGFILATVISAFQFQDMLSVFITIGIFLFAQIVESYYLTPRFVGSKVSLHPVWVIFAIFAGGILFGFTGVLIALPAAAVIGVLIRFTIKQYRNGSIYLGK